MRWAELTPLYRLSRGGDPRAYLTSLPLESASKGTTTTQINAPMLHKRRDLVDDVEDPRDPKQWLENWDP
jgi:hypothetical protein